MGVPARYILHQGPVIRGLGGGALAILRQRFGDGASRAPTVPGPEHRLVMPPRPPDLIKSFVRHVGGDPGSYRRTVPAHLFPQWGFALAPKVLETVPYPLAKALNGGCRVEVRHALPQGEPLHVRARLESIDDNGRRAVLQTRIITGTASEPDSIIADLFAIVPLGKKDKKTDKSKRPKKERPRIPASAREVARFRLGTSAGLDFAKLTGDFNPIHWIPGAARASGFRNVILHGFGTMSRAWEGVVRNVYAGDPSRITEWDCRFTRPLVLPAKVGLYLEDSPGQEPGGQQHRVYVGDAVGGPAYLVGGFRDEHTSQDLGPQR